MHYKTGRLSDMLSSRKLFKITGDFDPLAVEFCLAHKLRDRVEAAYLRTDLLVKRRHILEEWGSYAGS